MTSSVGMNPVGLFLLTPFPAAVAGSAISWATGGFPRPVSVLLFYLLLLYALQLLFGLAIRSHLVRRGRRSALHFALGGMLMVAIPVVPYMVLSVAQRPDRAGSAMIVLPLWLMLGAITGLTYWFLDRRSQRLTGATGKQS